MDRKITGGALAALLVLGPGCAGNDGVRMDLNRPIETEHGYQQDGKDLDNGDMIEKLEHEQASAPAIKRAQVLGVVATVLASAGGALIGWPLGQKAGGNPNPSWGLAYAGAGALVLSIPTIVWEVDSVKSGVAAHNRRFEAE